jgi:uncharacterized Fe-S cluster protein YjdI
MGCLAISSGEGERESERGNRLRVLQDQGACSHAGGRIRGDLLFFQFLAIKHTTQMSLTIL